MFAIAIDLDTRAADARHPRKARRAYADIELTLARYGFARIQWSVYAAKEEDLGKLFEALTALRAFDWFGPSVKSVRAFRIEQGSDFTAIVKRSDN